MRKKTLWLLGISLLFLILVTVLGIVWEDAAQQVDFARKNLPPGTGRAVWNRLDGAEYAETDGCRAFFKHPAGASDRGDQRRGGIGACIAGVAWRGTDGFIGMRAD